MPLLDVMFSMFVLFLWIAWIVLVFRVFVDIFRSSDLRGWGKAGWALLVIVLPFIGVLLYLGLRGDKLAQHGIDDAARQEEAVRAYIRDASGSASSPADEIARLDALRTQGAISDEEFAQLKAKVLAWA